ncbi:MAG: phosphoglycerate dehydrogenase [Bacteroidia bacterium]|nr:phosphoglycerate dehydrogenase [Bacteroidia bacterium]MCW5919489.1 phosphoglycerate dehydrogenase [Bacteroidota bacterium]MCC7515061.1 phosphoglycerate dehydrogenase [Bacteroidia bacterium]HMU77137.1 phosphoglycerate dehydrogenase [Bacteroidia bacterium]HMW10300.1 phosphoglycerate dehydrogenase [Bacteroidia bacterium]
MSLTSFPKEKIKILLLEGVHPAAVAMFKDAGYTQIETTTGALSEKELLQKISNIHILGIRSKTQLTAAVIAQADKLIATGCFCIGVNQVSMGDAIENGIAVFNSPFSNTRSVAELVIANCIMLLRRIPEKSNAALAGKWLKDSAGCFEVRGKTLGIIGYGHIGSQVSVLAEALGMQVIFYDVEPKLILGNAKACKSLNDLLKQSDIVTLHVPGTSATRNMVNESFLRKMKKGSVLINLSRGEVMDEGAIAKAITEKHLAGLAADVFSDEPQHKGDIFQSPLQHLNNVLLTPHIGGSTLEAQENIGTDVAGKIIRYLETGNSMGSVSVPALNLPLQQSAHRILHIHRNVPGVLSEINTTMSKHKANILGQYLQTNNTIGYVAVDIDKKASSGLISDLKNSKETIKVRGVY